MDKIFKALADPARRTLLDALRSRNGQSLAELTEILDMTRFGVMKHLGVLIDANLIVARKEGRFKYHYLNALPLQEAVDRWVEPLIAQPVARAILDIKAQLEGTSTLAKPDFVMQTFIRCTHDALWDALTNPDSMASYHFACDTVTGRAEEGDSIQFILPDGNAMLSQSFTKVEPKSRIETTFEPHFFGPDAPGSNMVYLVEPQGPTCKLTIEHYDIPTGQDGVAEGWARLAASLKSWLETGTGMKAQM